MLSVSQFLHWSGRGGCELRSNSLHLLLFAFHSFSFAVVRVSCGPSGMSLPQCVLCRAVVVCPLVHLWLLAVATLVYINLCEVTTCSADRLSFRGALGCINWFQSQSAVSSPLCFTASFHARSLLWPMATWTLQRVQGLGECGQSTEGLCPVWAAEMCLSPGPAPSAGVGLSCLCSQAAVGRPWEMDLVCCFL